LLGEHAAGGEQAQQCTKRRAESLHHGVYS
jgi:hypothetical protein